MSKPNCKLANLVSATKRLEDHLISNDQTAFAKTFYGS